MSDSAPAGSAVAVAPVPTGGNPRGLFLAALKLMVLVALAAAVLFGFRNTPLAEWLSADRMAALRARLGPAAGPLWSLAYGTLIGLWVPGTPLTALGAAVFPPGQAVFWNYLGAVSGAIVGFSVARGLGREAARTLFRSRFPLFDRYESVLQKRGFESVLYLRMLPTPYTLVSWVAGMSPVSLSTHALATAIGILPGSIAFTLVLGGVVAAFREGDWTGLLHARTLVAVAVWFLVLMSPWVVSWAQRRFGVFAGLKIRGGGG